MVLGCLVDLWKVHLGSLRYSVHAAVVPIRWNGEPVSDVRHAHPARRRPVRPVESSPVQSSRVADKKIVALPPPPLTMALKSRMKAFWGARGAYDTESKRLCMCLCACLCMRVDWNRSLADVVIHEITHSWTGNLVTNRTWEHFWLNEGWTMFVQRKIVRNLYVYVWCVVLCCVACVWL